jgi:hypothetical protein
MKNQEIAKTAGFKSDTSKIIACQWEQMKEIMQDATWNKGTLNSNQQQFLNAVFAAVAPSAHEAPGGKLVAGANAPSMRGRAKALGLGRSLVNRQLKIATKKRLELRAAANSGPWAQLVKKRKGKLKISPEAVEAVREHIVHHENVIHSPIANDSLLIKLPGMAVKSRVGKLLLEIPVRELHNQMVAEDGLKEARDSEGQASADANHARHNSKSLGTADKSTPESKTGTLVPGTAPCGPCSRVSMIGTL